MFRKATDGSERLEEGKSPRVQAIPLFMSKIPDPWVFKKVVVKHVSYQVLDPKICFAAGASFTTSYSRYPLLIHHGRGWLQLRMTALYIFCNDVGGGLRTRKSF